MKYIICLVTISIISIATVLAQEIEPISVSDKDAITDSSKIIMPIFPGGIDSMLKFISTNIKYPKDARKKKIQGQVVVRFVISETGQVVEAEAIKKLYPSCDKEAIKVISSMPKWIPGEYEGRVVKVYFTIPINFKLPKK